MATKRFELGLARDYISDWTVSNALREFMQNAIDQANTNKDNAYSVEYDEEAQELRISNKSSILKKESLLLGTTTKSATDIGGFGEGYKLACLVMVRNNIGVRFENYGAREIWTFKFSKLKKYNYKESLVCDVESQAFFKKVPNDNFTIVLSGLSEDQYEDYLDLLINPDATTIDTRYGRIIKDEDYKGKIYVSGLYVATKEGYEYGYDIKPEYIKIGRDRNLIADWDLSGITRDMWLDVAADERELIMEMLVNSTKDVEHFQYSWGLSYSDSKSENRREIADEMYKEMEGKYGKGVILAHCEDDREKLSHKYKEKKIVVVPTNIYSLIDNASPSYSDAIDLAEEEVEENNFSIEDQIYNWASKEGISIDSLIGLFDIIGDLVREADRKAA
jgi:hypothetical protein